MSPRLSNLPNYLKLILNPRQNPHIRLWVDWQPKLWVHLHKSKQRQIDQKIEEWFKGKTGICIGGVLRWRFQKALLDAAKVVYVDVVPFYPGQAVTPDYLADAGKLDFAQDCQYDFICSSHVLEHSTNPLKVISEWKRVLKPKGLVYCAMPDKRFTFDHKRKRTPIEHLIADYNACVGLKDLTHITEITNKSDLKLSVGTRKEFLDWLDRYVQTDNENTLILTQPHHHVYVKDDVFSLFEYAGFNVLFTELIGDTVHLVGEKN